jgi:hypothetical protein
MKQHRKGSDGKYHIAGKVYEELEGSRAKVFHGTAYKTAGGLLKGDLVKNKHDRIVSKKKQATAKREKRLEKAGYFAKKGKFGCFRKDGKSCKAKKSRTGKSRKARGTRKARK